MKYEELEGWLRRDIENGLFGSDLPSSRELARRYGATRPSMDRAIGELRASGLVESLPRVGHRIIEKQKSPATVAWLWPDETGPGSLFHDAFDAVRSGFPKQHNLWVQTYGSEAGPEREALLKLLGQKVDGVFALPHMAGGRLTNLDLYLRLSRMNVKMIFLMRDVREIPATSIFYDQKTVMDAKFNRLIAKGARTLIYLSDHHEVMAPRRIHFDLHWCPKYPCHWFEFEDTYPQTIQRVIDAMVEKFDGVGLAGAPGPLGFAGAHDHYIYGAYRACQKLGIKGAAYTSIGFTRQNLVSFLGVDPTDIPPSVFDYPELSFRAGDIGRAALERMNYMLAQHTQIPESISFPVFYPKTTGEANR